MWTVGVHYAVYCLYILYLFNCTDDGPLKKNCVHNLHTTFSITCDNCIQLCPVASAFHSFGTFNFRKYYFFLVLRRDVKTCVVLYIYISTEGRSRSGWLLTRDILRFYKQRYSWYYLLRSFRSSHTYARTKVVPVVVICFPDDMCS